MGKIILKKVNKSFGATQVIPGIDLTIEDGEFVVFVGPSGCGKSTLLRLIAGLEDTTSGTIEIDGTTATIVLVGVDKTMAERAAKIIARHTRRNAEIKE